MIKSKIICIGEALIDQIISNSGQKNKNYFGGAPANVACALRKLDLDTVFIGCIGDDNFGKGFRKLFNDLGVNIDFLQTSEEFPTRIVQVKCDDSGDRSFSGFKNLRNDFFADEILDKAKIESTIVDIEKLFLQTNFIVTGTILLASKRSSEALSFLLDYAQDYRIKIVIDVNWREVFWDNSQLMKNVPMIERILKIKHFLEYADVLKLAYEEALLFFENIDPIKISNSLPKTPDVIITNGGNSIYWFINGKSGENKVINSLRIVDTTGAGDAFLAGLISKLANDSTLDSKKEIYENIHYASICGLLTCKGKGAIEQQPTHKEVQRFLLGFGS